MQDLGLRPVNPMNSALQGFAAMDQVLNNREDRKTAALDRERRVAREDSEDAWQKTSRARTEKSWEDEDASRALYAAKAELDSMLTGVQDPEKRVALAQSWVQKHGDLLPTLSQHPLLATREARQETIAQADNFHRGMMLASADPNQAKHLVMASLNHLQQEQIQRGGSRPGTSPLRKRLSNAVFTEDGKAALELEVEALDDETGDPVNYRAPVTVNRTGGPEDQVRLYDPEQVAGTVDRYQVLAQAIEAELIRRGDPTALADARTRSNNVLSAKEQAKSFGAIGAAYDADASPAENAAAMYGAALQASAASGGRVTPEQAAQQVATMMDAHDKGKGEWVAVDFQDGDKQVQALVDKSKVGKKGVTDGNWKSLQQNGALVLLGEGDNAALIKARSEGKSGGGKVTSADRTQLYSMLASDFVQEAIDNFKAKNKNGDLPDLNFGDPRLADQSWKFVLAHANPKNAKKLKAQLEYGENFVGSGHQPAGAARMAVEQYEKLNQNEGNEQFVVGEPKGLVEGGNIDLGSRPVVKNKDGSISTVRSITLTLKGGKAILIPTVSPDGKILSDKEAVAFAKKTGQHLGVFDSVAAADQYAEQLHNQQASAYR